MNRHFNQFVSADFFSEASAIPLMAFPRDEDETRLLEWRHLGIHFLQRFGRRSPFNLPSCHMSGEQEAKPSACLAGYLETGTKGMTNVLEDVACRAARPLKLTAPVATLFNSSHEKPSGSRFARGKSRQAHQIWSRSHIQVGSRFHVATVSDRGWISSVAFRSGVRAFCLRPMVTG